MFRCTMFLLKLHLFTLTLYGLIFDLDALNCPPGQRIVVSGNREQCEDCQSGFFQNKESYTQSCQPCTICDKASGSFIAQMCTKTSNTICKCHEGFKASDEDFSTCHCKAGFGKVSGECTECEHGSFSKYIDSPCKKWKECKSGVQINGTKTSDVICKKIPQTDMSPTLGRVVSSATVNQTPGLLTTTTTTTIMSPTRQFTLPNAKVQPSSPSSTANSFGSLITFAAVGMLVLIVMIIKLYFAFYKEKHESVQKRESLCRRPVEEIGGGSQVSVKLDLEEN